MTQRQLMKVIGAVPILPSDYTADDSPATLSALATLEPALAFTGATAVVIKGGETETDAGYRLLMQQAAATNPEAIVSMHGQSGCVALMRALTHGFDTAGNVVT